MAKLAERQRDAYAVLGLQRDATQAEIKKAYRALALQLHPDKLGEPYADEELRQVATQRFQELQSAFEDLQPGNRKRYDAGIGAFVLGKTELMEACEARDLEKVLYLLEQKADVNETDSTGRTALLFAASAASVPILRALLEHGADIACRNCAGHSVVMFAVGAGLKVDSPEKVERALEHLESARLLLDQGAPINARTGYGLSALMLACASGRLNMVDLLLSRDADAKAATDIGLTPLVMAADRGHAEIVRRLLQAGADANTRFGPGKTALMGAAALGHVSVVAALLEGSADVNLVSNDGHTALLYAVERGLKDGLACPIAGENVQKPGAVRVTETLLAAGADPNHIGPRGQTALHLLFNRGVSPDSDAVDDSDSKAALTSLIEVLVASGARRDIKDDNGLSVVEVARTSDEAALAKTLARHDQGILGSLKELMQGCCIDIRRVMSAGASLLRR